MPQTIWGNRAIRRLSPACLAPSLPSWGAAGRPFNLRQALSVSTASLTSGAVLDEILKRMHSPRTVCHPIKEHCMCITSMVIALTTASS
eukprot:3113726-Amphidinium_carterae.1